MFELEFDARDTIRNLRKLSIYVGLSVRDVCYEQKRLWLNDLIRRTAPKALGEGKHAVADDITKIFKAVNNPTVLEVWEEELKAGGFELTRTTKRGKVAISRKQITASSRSAIAMIHERHRRKSGSRAGRVKFTRDNQRVWGGKWLVPRKDLKAHLLLKQKHIGKLKAGWLPAAEYYAGKAHGSVKAPEFVRRHGSKYGTHRDTMSWGGSGDMVSSNQITWAGKSRYLKNWIEFTERVRRRDIQNQARKRVDRLVQRFNTSERAA